MKAARLAGFDITLVDTRGRTRSSATLLSDTYVPVEDFYKGMMALTIPAGAFIVITTMVTILTKKRLRQLLLKSRLSWDDRQP